MDRIDPWGSNAIEDYERLFNQFGIQPFSELIDILDEPNHLMRRSVIFGHRDFDKFWEAYKNGENVAVITGLMPSGKMHFGHKMVVDELLWFQERNIPVTISIASIEAYAVRELSQEAVKNFGIDEYLINYIALGLKPSNCEVYFQEERKSVISLAPLFSRRITFNELKAIYGELSPAKIVSALTQVADILHIQLEKYGGPKYVNVPVGADQDPHIRLTRDVASRYFSEYGFISPTATYHRFLLGLGGGKMSSSVPTSYIALTDALESAKSKLMNSFTGGRDTKKEQQELGGRPEICPVAELMRIHLIKDDDKFLKLYEQCKSGELICGDCKKIAWSYLQKFLEEHQKKREKARDNIDKYLVRD